MIDDWLQEKPHTIFSKKETSNTTERSKMASDLKNRCGHTMISYSKNEWLTSIEQI